MDCLNLVTGDPVNYFSLLNYILGCVTVLPFVSVFVLIILLFICIAQSRFLLSDFFVYIFLTVFTWLIIIPISVYSFPQLESKISIPVEQSALSAGFFREERTGVFYYLGPSKYEGYNTLQFDYNGYSGVPGKVYFRTSHVVPSSLYVDPLVNNIFNKNETLSNINDALKSFAKIASTMLAKSRLQYLIFASLGLALWSLSGLAFFSKWKTLNISLILVFVWLLINLNLAFYVTPLFDTAVSSLVNRLPNLNFLSSIYPLCINGVITLFFSIIGIIFHPVSNKEIAK
jgi:hypothetical protein